MAAKKKDPETGLYGYPVTTFQGPGGKTDVVQVTSAVMEHNLRAAGYAPAKGETAPTEEEEKAEAADKAPDTPAQTTTQTTR